MTNGKTCTVEGCSTDHYAKGFCRKHYNAQNHVKGMNPADRKTWPGKGLSGEPRLTAKAVEEMVDELLPKAFERLGGLLDKDGTEDWALIKITELLSDRKMGKPSQAITGPDGGPIQIQAQQLHATLVAIAEGPSDTTGQIEGGRPDALEAAPDADSDGGGEADE